MGDVVVQMVKGFGKMWGEAEELGEGLIVDHLASA